ncbi:Retrovirus-related Pol polyprotein from transposon TNT 1-94 [Linum grandiflorum]
MNPPSAELLNVRFNGKNYALWSFQFRFLVAGKELLPYLDGTAAKPGDDATATAKSTWETRNAQVFSWLLGSIEANIALTLRTHTCAATVWDLLSKRYSQTNSSRTFELEYELAQINQGELDIRSFHLLIQNLWTEQDLISTSTYTTDVYDAMLKERNKARVIQLLMKLRPEFEAVRSSLISGNIDDFDKVLGELVHVEICLRTQSQIDNGGNSGFFAQPATPNQPQSVNASTLGSVFAAQHHRPQFRSTLNPVGSSSSPGEIRCRHCSETGHPQSLCKKQNFCNYCKRSGHIITDCRNRQKNESRFGSRSSNRSGGGSYGGNRNNNTSTAYSTQPGDLPSSNSNINQLVRTALSEVLPEALQSAFALFRVTGKPHSWLLDSAAFNYMTSDRSLFKAYQSVPHMGVRVANGESLYVAGIGRVSTSHLELPDTLHVPNLVPNLVSVGQLTDHGCVVSFSPTGCSIQDQTSKCQIGSGSKVGRNFVLTSCGADAGGSSSSSNIQNIENDVSFGVSNNVSPSVRKWSLWHARLGHPHFTRLRLMIQQHLIPTSINFKDLDTSATTCVYCIEAKTKKLSFSASTSQDYKPFDLIHTDLWGPSPVTSRLGFRYFVLLINQATRYTWVYMLHLKSDLCRIIQEFISMIQTQFNHTVKVICSDSGGEYSSTSLHDFYKKQGIIFQSSCLGVSEQNGLVERKNRHVMELARALLLDSRVPSIFRPEVVHTVVYLINRQISSTLHNQSPFSVLYRKKPDYARLRTFGCTCFVLIPRHERTKLTSKTARCVFMGYSNHHKGYLCYDEVAKRIRIAYHVIFLEHLPYFQNIEQITPAPSLDTAMFSLDLFGSLPTAHNIPLLDDPSPPPSPPPSAGPRLTSPSIVDFGSSSSSSASSTGSSSLAASPSVRRSTRSNIGTRPSRYDDYVVYACDDPTIPKTYAEACLDPRWVAAMQEEIRALEENHTWDVVLRPAHTPIIGCRWIFTIKRHSDGSIDRYKARLVAQGFRQEYGIDYDETFAPVAKMQTVRTLLAVAARQNWELNQLDIKNAFLHGDLKEVVYLACPPSYISSDSSKVACLLRRSLYGLKQAPRAWFEKFQTTILSHGFHQSLNDPSLFTKRTVAGLTVLLLYVDDMILTGDDVNGIAAVKKVLHDSFKLKDLGTLSYFLGLEIQRSTRRIFVSQRKYISELLEEAHHSTCTPVSTPMEVNLKLSREDGELLVEPTLYRKLVGSLIYLTSTRPDLAYAVQVVSQFMGNPRKPHLDAVYRIMRYLQGTRTMGIFFPSTGSMEVSAFADADYAGCFDTRRSTSGWCVKVGDACVAWRCKKQERISKSSTEVEYRSMSEVCSEVVWLTRLLAELGHQVELPVHLHADNTSAIQIATNPVLHDRTKHIETHVHYIRQLIQTGEVKLHYLNTEDQVADALTKALGTSRHWFYLPN